MSEGKPIRWADSGNPNPQVLVFPPSPRPAPLGEPGPEFWSVSIGRLTVECWDLEKGLGCAVTVKRFARAFEEAGRV